MDHRHPAPGRDSGWPAAPGNPNRAHERARLELGGVDYRIDDAAGVAEVMAVRRDLGIHGGMVVANPIPAEHSMDRAVIDAAIDTALAEAEAQNIVGKDSTPFLLARVVELTGSASLDANIQLVLSNARVAADIAIAASDAA